MILKKRVLRTILDNKSRYLGSFLLILLSCSLYISFIIAGTNVKNNLVEFRKDNIMEDANFIVQNTLNDISDLEMKYDLILEERNSYDYGFDSSSTLRLLKETKKINKYTAVKGKPIKSVGEILFDQGFAKAHKLNIGNIIKIENKNFKITGLMTTPDYVYPLKTESDLIKNPDAFGIAIVSEQDFKDIDKGLMFYSIKFNNENKISEFKDCLNKDNMILKWVNKEDNTRISFINSDLEGLVQTGEFFPIAILILTCILLSVVLWRLLKTEFVQIGTLYALGYKKSEIMLHYLNYPLILSAAGSISGTTLGYFLIKPLLYVVTTYYNLPGLSLNYNFKYFFTSLALPFLFLIPTVIFVILKVLRLSPVALMRGGGNKVKIGFVEKRLNFRKVKFNTKFKLREILRNIPRTLLMILGVTFASMLLLMGFVTKDSIDYMVGQGYTGIYRYNYDYMFSSFQTGKVSEGETVSMSPFVSAKNIEAGNTFIIYGVPKNAKLIELKNSNGAVLSMDSIIATKSLANKLGIHKGDNFEVQNRFNLKKFFITVDEIANAYIGDFIYMPIDQFNSLSGYPEDSYLELWSESKLNIGQDKLIFSINKNDIINGYKALVEPLRYMIGLIAAVAFIIGIIVIFIVTSLIIEENKFNISLLKVFGYSKKRIYSLILNSNTSLLIIGYILSIPLILLSIGKYFDMLTYEMNITLPVKLNTINIIIGFIFIFITYEISKFLNRKKIVGISMAESLKSKFE